MGLTLGDTLMRWEGIAVALACGLPAAGCATSPGAPRSFQWESVFWAFNLRAGLVRGYGVELPFSRANGTLTRPFDLFTGTISDADGQIAFERTDSGRTIGRDAQLADQPAVEFFDNEDSFDDLTTVPASLFTDIPMRSLERVHGEKFYAEAGKASFVRVIDRYPNYGKIGVVEISAKVVTFDFAFQRLKGNRLVDRPR
ncbi:MAG: hypothetical protein FJZ01_08465 [Candidatus Sericytochromatia bacterium]|nr:hypothetical protein [Candidatus Tanganyikabacteria bacterium]